MLLFLLVAVCAAQSQQDDLVDLGAYYSGPALGFDLYAGYLDAFGSKFYYWFATSERNPKTDALVAFYNGGPGCSSVSGSLTEMGPLQPNENGTGVVLREFRWTSVANMLWIESPAGVGFSYTPGTPINSTYATDDKETAKVNLAVLQAWFARFPQYAEHDFYLSGESYSGTYIPTLTVKLLEFNQQQPAHRINLQGLLIGNPCTDEIIDHNAFFEMVSTHDLIDAPLAAAIVETCPPTFRYIPDNTCCQFNYSAYPPQSEACRANLQRMYALFANNNLYDIYWKCSGGPSGSAPCVYDGALNTLLNDDAFRRVIHAAPSSEIGTWFDCTPHLNYTSNYHSIFEQIWPQIFELNSKLRVQIYSGDADACVPFFGTRTWTRLLGGNVTDPWRPWQSQGQLAGYTIGYQQLRFVSLKGCGHMAPQFQPAQSLTMFQNYLDDKIAPFSPGRFEKQIKWRKTEL